MTAPRPHLAAPAPSIRAFARWMFGAGLVLLVSACNRDPCAGLHAPTPDPNAPQIVAVSMASVDVINPWQFNFALEFTDRNGDLAAGLLDIYIGSSEPVTLDLLPYFHSSEVDPGATAGRLGIDLNFAMGGVQDDNVLRLGFQLRDGLLNYSNCYTLDMHFAIDRLGLVRPAKLRRAACGAQLALRTTP